MHQGGAARRALLALGDSETTDEVLGASEPEVGLDLDDGRDHEEDLDALNDILGALMFLPCSLLRCLGVMSGELHAAGWHCCLSCIKHIVVLVVAS